jgi:hypothetical protein
MGSKGPSGNTTTTQTQQNPAANAQLPYLQQLWGGAAGLAQQPSPYIGAGQGYAAGQAQGTQDVAGSVMPNAESIYTSMIQRGMPAVNQTNQLFDNSGNASNWGLTYGQGLNNTALASLNNVPYWQQAFSNAGQQANNTLQNYGSAATGALSGVGNYAMNTLPGMGQAATNQITGLAPGALGGMTNLAGQAAGAGNPAEAGLYGNAGVALGGNPAFSSGLQGLASGAYINPATNPAYASMIQNATQPLVNQYQTATAPQVASQFEGAGRYGSGAQTNAQGQAQYGLGQALSNAVSGITNNAYNTGIQATGNAGQALGGIYNQGVSNATSALSNAGQLAQSGVNNAANIYNQGYGTAGNLLNQGYATGGNLINQGITGGTNALSNAYQIGGGLSGQGYSQQNAFMGNAANTGLGYLNAGLTGQQAAANAIQAGYGTANTGLTASGNLANQGTTALNTALSQAPTFGGYPASQYTAAYNAPWLPSSDLSSILGNAIGGSGTEQTTQPYYSNTAANVLGGLSGGLGLISKAAPLLAGF